MSQRHIPLDGQPNFRDIGGYTANDGRQVRWGTVYRSGELNKLSDRDLDKLAELGLRTVVDLRSDAEIAALGEPRLPDGVRVLPIPVASGNLVQDIIPPLLAGDFSKVPPDLLISVNRRLARSSGPRFGQLLRTLTDPKQHPVVFHCTLGKDRTGFAAAVVLMALGVSWEQVVADYLLSNELRRTENERMLAMIRSMSAKARSVSEDEVDLARVRSLLFVDPSAIEAAREEMISQSGSVGEYVVEGLGLNAHEVDALRDGLLQ